MECERKNKWWRGCKFEPRYDSRLPNGLEMNWGSSADLEAIKNKTYVADVCVTCGKKIKRDE